MSFFLYLINQPILFTSGTLRTAFKNKKWCPSEAVQLTQQILQKYIRMNWNFALPSFAQHFLCSCYPSPYQQHSLPWNFYYPEINLQQNLTVQQKIQSHSCFQPIAERVCKEKQDHKNSVDQLAIAQPDLLLQKESLSQSKQTKKAQKKNTQTNLINQVFSYLLLPQKSLIQVTRLLMRDQKKIKTFYAYMKTLKLSKPKYLNKSYLHSLVFLPHGKSMCKTIIRSKKRAFILSISEFRSMLFKLVFLFLRKQSQLNIVASKKMAKRTIMIHLQKRRELIEFLQQSSVSLSSGSLRQKQIGQLNNEYSVGKDAQNSQ